jgi:hypothetical protein
MQSASLQQFRGLSLNADPEKAGPYATDLLNVQFDRPDRVRTRDGYGRLNSVAVPGPVVGIARYAGAYGANPQYVVAYTSGANTIAKVYDSTGAAVGATQTIGGVFLGFVSTEYGTGTSNYLYVANATDTNFVTATFRWDGAVWTSPAGLPTRNAGLAVSPLDNRMVTLAGATGVRSRIHFSNAGDAETYGPNNYVDLHPNDGEYLAGLVAWKDITPTTTGRRSRRATGRASSTSAIPARRSASAASSSPEPAPPPSRLPPTTRSPSGTGTAVTLGTSPAVAEGYYNGPGKARNFSIEVSSTTAQWSLSSLTANIATVRQSGLRAA